jgi:hypothetical protein
MRLTAKAKEVLSHVPNFAIYDWTWRIAARAKLNHEEALGILNDLEYWNYVRRRVITVKDVNYTTWAKQPKDFWGRACASCRRGEKATPADVYAKGIIPGLTCDGREVNVPYRGYLCLDHFHQLEMDDAKLEIKMALSRWGRDAARKRREIYDWDFVEVLLREHTSWKNAEDFLQGNPTISEGAFRGADYLRNFYRTFTGIPPRTSL